MYFIRRFNLKRSFLYRREIVAVSVFLKEGVVFSGCRILSLCGKGAFGITYLAQTPLDEKIIVKVVSSATGAEKELKGVRNYMQIAGSHPNLLKIFHTGITEEGFFYTMEAADNIGSNGEYVPATLSNLLKKYRSFTPEEAIRIVRELLSAVRVMHENGLIHRDIKPENIIFVNGRPKLSDPGLVTEVGKTVSFAGTFGFVPPECFNGSVPIAENGDLYALGMVFYCMVTGFGPKEYPRLPLDMRIEVCRQISPALHLMCNRNPDKRFTSADDFLKGLPEKLENPTCFEKFREKFRQWRGMHRKTLRAATLIMTLFLLLAAGSATAFLLHSEKERAQMENWKKEIASFNAADGKRRSLLEFQLEHLFPEHYSSYLPLKQSLEKNLKLKKFKKAAEKSRLLKTLLVNASAKEFHRLSSALPDPGNQERAFAAAGAFHGFAVSPLAFFAPPEAVENARRKIAVLEKNLYANYSGPRCGKDWFSLQHQSDTAVFVGPGAFRMRHNNKVVKIPYHYWIGKYEITGENVSVRLGFNPRRPAVAHTPVNHITWNDILFYCYTSWQLLSEYGVLPPGYIVRPPTEAEWEFAARNGWLGEDDTPLEKRAVIKSNSNNHLYPVGSRLPGKLGIFDIYGNVSEMVIPHDPPAMQLAVIARGGRYSAGKEKCYARESYLAFQHIPDAFGFRVVIAPGDSSFYDRHFFMGGPMSFRYKNKVLELVGSLASAFNWHSAEEFSRLLGGKLAEFENEEEMKAVVNHFPLLNSWPAYAGVRKVNGEWLFYKSGKKVSFGKWSRFRGTGEPAYAAVTQRYWRPLSNLYLPLFLCEWDAEKFPGRNAHLDKAAKLPLELARFTHGDREFILIDSGIRWYGAKRVCELLGGRLAVLDSEELRQKAVEKLKDFKHNIALGAYAKRNSFLFLDGKAVTFPLKEHPRKDYPGRNRNFLTLQQGVFYNAFYSTAFLLERRRSSVSSSSR